MNCNPLLTQVKPTYFSLDCGMAYIIRLSDGRFVLIDAMYGEYDEMDRVYDLLCEQNLLNDIPTIAMWFFTHPHDDHVGGLVEMQKKYGNKIRVQKVCYDFPSYEVCAKGCDIDAFFDAVRQTGAQVVTPKSGDVFCLAKEKFEILYTASDWKDDFYNINDSSLVMKISLGNYTFMSTSDVMTESSDIILKNYTAEQLKCDIMQVPHHGYSGGSTEFFKAVDPQILLWPIPEYRYIEISEMYHNRFFKYMDNNIEHIFIAGIEQNVFDMTKPIKVTTPYKPTKIQANFEKKSVGGLGWACIMGEGKGNSPLDLVFENKSCILKTRSGRSLLQMVQKGQVATSDKYRFELEIIPKKQCAELGLAYDTEQPVRSDAIMPYPIKHMEGQRTLVAFMVNHTAGTIEISLNGETETLPLRTKNPCDIILVINDGEIVVDKFIFENL